MIGASIVAMDHELDPPLLTVMISVGFSFPTLPAWWYVTAALWPPGAFAAGQVNPVHGRA